ncbi:hypothetical protein AVEN_182346-1 [Araneus ventricosus]|uniref:Uncharacterized protein n=1 Tax=Araneus ventricosus TaxID=182803 RepID=A0A4Y2TTS4_ARAVE|nr:hypothetical protein AVEN_182346-1 [Araneus ventricosus]
MGPSWKPGIMNVRKGISEKRRNSWKHYERITSQGHTQHRYDALIGTRTDALGPIEGNFSSQKTSSYMCIRFSSGVQYKLFSPLSAADHYNVFRVASHLSGLLSRTASLEEAKHCFVTSGLLTNEKDWLQLLAEYKKGCLIARPHYSDRMNSVQYFCVGRLMWMRGKWLVRRIAFATYYTSQRDTPANHGQE